MTQETTEKKRNKQLIWWLAAMIAGLSLGVLGISAIDTAAGIVATVYTRLFQLLSVPTIALAVATTLARFGSQSGTGRIFRRAIVYTLLTTLAASLVGLGLYVMIAPGNLPAFALQGVDEAAADGVGTTSYAEHILSVIPNNAIRPLLEGNVLSILLIAAAVGVALARMPASEGKTVVVNGLNGLQELLFILIRWLIWSLPVGIVAFAAQLSAQMSAGVAADSLGRYVAVVLIGNMTQIFIVLPLFLLSRGINPFRTLGRMMPAVMMGLFTKSSAATLPVTIETSESRMGVSPKVSRFVLPICTTINMNGCAAFILVTSLFVMQNGGMELSLATMLTWVVVSVVAAVGNAGVPMGCYFLTLSLMAGHGAPVGIMGAILPVYTIIDMVETAENVWSDSCVAAMTDRDMRRAGILEGKKAEA
ncbi:MAG: dicarboxylate/amino acid:cation symporter [Marinilabiliaceae bacterium]